MSFFRLGFLSKSFLIIALASVFAAGTLTGCGSDKKKCEKKEGKKWDADKKKCVDK